MRLRNTLLSSLLVLGFVAGCSSDDDSSNNNNNDSNETPSSESVTDSVDESTDDTAEDTASDATAASADSAEASVVTVTDGSGSLETMETAASVDPTMVTVGDETAVGGDIEMTFTVFDSVQNPSLNGVPTTVSGYCDWRPALDIFLIEGGTSSDPAATDRPDHVSFIASAPVDGQVSGLLDVVEQGLNSSSLSATGTFDGTTLTIIDEDAGTPIFELVLATPCVEQQ